jgi:hypothetical protein
MKNIREGVGQVDGGWLGDNISQQVGDGNSTRFSIDPFWIVCP